MASTDIVEFTESILADGFSEAQVVKYLELVERDPKPFEPRSPHHDSTLSDSIAIHEARSGNHLTAPPRKRNTPKDVPGVKATGAAMKFLAGLTGDDAGNRFQMNILDRSNHFLMSRTASPASRKPLSGWRPVLACCVILGASTMIIAAFTSQSLKDFLTFAFRGILVFVAIYKIMFIFYENGARPITETFLVSFSVIALTYFIIACPIGHFVWSLVLSAGVAGFFHFLD
jgi:hypothetical protein